MKPRLVDSMSVPVDGFIADREGAFGARSLRAFGGRPGVTGGPSTGAPAARRASPPRADQAAGGTAPDSVRP